MSKSINLEVVSLEDGYAVLEADNGTQLEMDFEYLPDNLKEGRCLRFIISHTDFNPNKEEEYAYREEINISEFPKIINGKRLTY